MNAKTFEDVFPFDIETSPMMQEINAAIDSRDIPATVRAATVLLKLISPVMNPINVVRKSVDTSNQLRKDGNVHYINKDYRQAIVCYNKALAYAPNDSLELKLAYSNISAVLLAIKAYRDCQTNIEAALNLDCPAFLRVKLEKRYKETLKYLNEPLQLKNLLDISPLLHLDNKMRKFIEFDVERNVNIPGASADVLVDGDKNIVAANDIAPGTMVALEKAFVSIQSDLNEYISCYNCHKMCFFYVTCDGCSKALFCTKECRDKCMKDFHRIECAIDVYSIDLPVACKLAVRAAIKMSLILSWEELSVASLEMGQMLLKKSGVSEAFDVNNPVSFLCYIEHADAVGRNVMYGVSIACAVALLSFENVPDYLPEEKEEKRKVLDTLSRIIVLFSTTFVRHILIFSPATDFYDKSFTRGAQLNRGVFSFTSKVEHSCEPNLLVVGFNDGVALVALQHIKKGDRLTISYIDHFYDYDALPPSTFQKTLKDNLLFDCKCRVCLNRWNNRSQVKLTRREQKAYNVMERVMSEPFATFGAQMAVICAALKELSGRVNSTQHCKAYNRFIKTLNMSQIAKLSNKAYRV